MAGGVPDIDKRSYQDEHGWHQEVLIKNFTTQEGATEFFKDSYFSPTMQRKLSLEWNKRHDMRSVITVEKDGAVLKNLLDCEGNICFKYQDGHCDPNSDCPASVERSMHKHKVIPIIAG